MTPASILRDLISISSVSSESNLGVVEYAQSILARQCWQWTAQPYEHDGVLKSNLVAWHRDRPFAHSRAGLAIVCHTDTVPYDWPEATHPIERDGKIFGRGACDVKGFLACVLSALPDLLPSTWPEPVCLILTADEEVGCIGAQHLGEAGLVRPRLALIGEPTGLQPVRAGKGYCLARITVTGREAHSAFPERGDSAIENAAIVIQQVQHRKVELRKLLHPAFDPPYTTVNIGTIEGGRAKNIVPGECRMLVEWRPIPGQSAETALQTLDPAQVEILRLQPGWETSETSPFLRSLCDLSGKPPGYASFGTEAPLFTSLGAECVVLGPGDMRVAHSREEHISIVELDTFRYFLTRFLTPSLLRCITQFAKLVL